MGMEVMASTANNKRTLFLCCLLVSFGATAGDWHLQSGVTVSELYTDNVDLTSSGERSAWITEVRPHFNFHRQGARLRADVDYNLQGLYYAGGSHGARVQHYLEGRANAELLEDWFFLDASARSSREPISIGSTTGVGSNNAIGSRNTSSVASYTLSPYLRHRFGSVASMEARVEHNGVFIGDSGASNADITRYSLSAVSGSASFPLSWSARYLKTDNDNRSSGISDTGDEQLSFNARYQLAPTFGLLAQAGKEKNDYTGVTKKVRDYSYYGLGFFYTPGRRFSMDLLFNSSNNGDFISGRITANPTLRTSIDVSSTQRAYGRSHSAGITHRTRHSTWSLRYLDDLTNYQQQYLNYAGSLFMYQCPGSVELHPPGVSPSDPGNCAFIQIVNIFNPALTNTTYVNKNLMGTVSYVLRRNTWSVSAYDNKREYKSLTAGSDETRGLQASWSVKPAANTTYTLTGGLSRNKENLAGRSDDLWNVGFVATRQFMTKLNGSVELRHQERSSKLSGNDYKENSIMARLNMSF